VIEAESMAEQEPELSDADLDDALGRYEAALIAAHLRPLAVHTYVDQSRRFLRWRVGEYVPRGVPIGGRPTAMGRVKVSGLFGDLARYEGTLRGAELQPPSVHTYVDQSRRFLRWLDGTYRPHRPHPESPTEPVAPIPAGTGTSSWLWEGNVQSALARYLEVSGWLIERLADTARRERGFDILASRPDRRLAVEVKGYPERTYSRGAKEGQRKVAVPSAQATVYFGGALASVTRYREADPNLGLAIGLPDVPRYRDLVTQRATSLRDLGIGVFLVTEDGTVSTLIEPAQHRPAAVTPESLFFEAIEWFRASYGERRYFVERDVVWTIQSHLLERVHDLSLPWQVQNDYATLPGARRALSADLAIVVDGSPELLVEFKYEPSHRRTDIPRVKLPVIGWRDVEKDAKRIRSFVDAGRTPIALALLVDEGGFFRDRPALPGGRWVDWESPADSALTVFAHEVRVAARLGIVE
jgi:hypothetical protein